MKRNIHKKVLGMLPVKAAVMALSASLLLTSCVVYTGGYSETDGVYYDPNKDTLPQGYGNYSGNQVGEYYDYEEAGIIEKNKHNQAESENRYYGSNWQNDSKSTSSDFGTYSGAETYYTDNGYWDMGFYRPWGGLYGGYYGWGMPYYGWNLGWGSNWGWNMGFGWNWGWNNWSWGSPWYGGGYYSPWYGGYYSPWYGGYYTRPYAYLPSRPSGPNYMGSNGSVNTTYNRNYNTNRGPGFTPSNRVPAQQSNRMGTSTGQYRTQPSSRSNQYNPNVGNRSTNYNRSTTTPRNNTYESRSNTGGFQNSSSGGFRSSGGGFSGGSSGGGGSRGGGGMRSGGGR